MIDVDNVISELKLIINSNLSRSDVLRHIMSPKCLNIDSANVKDYSDTLSYISYYLLEPNIEDLCCSVTIELVRTEYHRLINTGVIDDLHEAVKLVENYKIMLGNVANAWLGDCYYQIGNACDGEKKLSFFNMAAIFSRAYNESATCYEGFDTLYNIYLTTNDDNGINDVIERAMKIVMRTHDDKARTSIGTWLLDVLYNRYYCGEKLRMAQIKCLYDAHGMIINKGLYWTTLDPYILSCRYGKKVIEQNEELRKINAEKEALMAMYAHELSGPVRNIIYNTGHENHPKNTLRAAYTINSLLDALSCLSADDFLLKKYLKEETLEIGDENIYTVINYSIYLAMFQLLSVSSIERMRDYYYYHAIKKQFINKGVTFDEWRSCYRDLEKSLQSQWENELSEIDNNVKDTDVIQWFSQNFINLICDKKLMEMYRFDRYKKLYSIILIILQEVMVNAIKYSFPGSGAPIVVTLKEYIDSTVIVVENPTDNQSASVSKGYMKGHKLLRLVLDKIGGKFSAEQEDNTYSTIIELPISYFVRCNR